MRLVNNKNTKETATNTIVCTSIGILKRAVIKAANAPPANHIHINWVVESSRITKPPKSINHSVAKSITS